jgi:hypothetical protein
VAARAPAEKNLRDAQYLTRLFYIRRVQVFRVTPGIDAGHAMSRMPLDLAAMSTLRLAIVRTAA